MSKFLDEIGLAYLWDKIKSYIDSKEPSSGNFATVDEVTSAIDSTVGDINTILDSINGEEV